MCVVSAVLDYGRQTWPNARCPQCGGYFTIGAQHWCSYFQGSQQWPSPVTVEREPTPEEWKEFLELVEKAKKFDELTGQPHCEDPEKVSWMEEMEKRLAALERKDEGMVDLPLEDDDEFDEMTDEEIEAIDDDWDRCSDPCCPACGDGCQDPYCLECNPPL